MPSPMLRVDALLETVTDKNPETGDWSGETRHTSGMLNGIKPGWTGTLDQFNRRLTDIGYKPLTPDTLAAGDWTTDEDEPGRYSFSVVADMDGLPDESGDYLFDVIVDLQIITPQPLALADIHNATA